MFRTSRRISDDLFFIVLVVLAVAKMAMLRYFALSETNLLSAVVVESAIVVFILGVIDLVPPRRRPLLTLAGYAGLCVVMVVATIYVAFYQQLFDPRMLSVAGQLGTVKGSIRSLLKPIYVLFFADIPFLAAWAFVLGRAAKKRLAAVAAQPAPDDASPDDASPGSRSAQRRPAVLGRSPWVAGAMVLALVLFIVQLALAMRIPSDVDGVAVAQLRGIGVAQTLVFVPRGTQAAAQAGPVSEQLAPPSTEPTESQAATLAPFPETPGSKLQTRIESIRGAENGSRIATFSPGAYAGTNVIMIQVEALNTMVMQKTINGREITPNLNALLPTSWYFPNTYSQSGMGNTADAEFIVNTSLYAPKGQAAPVAYVGRAIPALPRVLREQKGYDAFTAHANTAAYWNRQELYATLGFARFYDKEFFGYEDRFNKMGVSDEVFFRKSMKLIRAAEATATPYLAEFVTLSAHGPFDLIPQSRRPVRTPKDLKGSLIGDYISAESYSDMALGQFFNALKTEGFWDDSIIILYGDHTSMNENMLSGKDARGSRELLGRPYTAADRQRVPLIIHLPGQTEAHVVTSTVGQVDIMPTVADLLGADLRGTPHMGRSVFVDSNALVPTRAYLPGGTFANDRVLFLPGVGFKDGKAFSIENAGRTEKSERERTDMVRVKELTKISDKWILGLPMRPDAPKKLIGGWIPDKAAREAAKPLGATQSGE